MYNSSRVVPRFLGRSYVQQKTKYRRPWTLCRAKLIINHCINVLLKDNIMNYASSRKLRTGSVFYDGEIAQFLFMSVVVISLIT